jgi:hypothetical protein
MLVSALALTAAVNAPATLAEDGHGHRDRGRDDVVVNMFAVQNPAGANVMDNDINDDRGVDTQVALQPTVDRHHDEVNDLDDDD